MATSTNVKYFGEGLKDWFGLASKNLVVIASDTGDTLRRTTVINATQSGSTQKDAGRFTSGVSEISNVWHNPTVTYRVVGDLTLNTKLGKAWKSSDLLDKGSGYMITSVDVHTAIGEFPTVTVSGTANEGADAVNLFTVSIPIEARARAQYLLKAISGGGNLQTCDVSATCQPVVCEEGGMPCASDVVCGRYVVRATTYAPAGEKAPTAVSGNGFEIVGYPKSCGDTAYPMWQVEAHKEIA